MVQKGCYGGLAIHYNLIIQSFECLGKAFTLCFFFKSKGNCSEIPIYCDLWQRFANSYSHVSFTACDDAIQ